MVPGKPPAGGRYAKTRGGPGYIENAAIATAAPMVTVKPIT